MMKAFFTDYIQSHRHRIKWLINFSLINIFLVYLVASYYLPMLFPIDLPTATFWGKVFVVIYIALTYLSFFALWACLPLWLLLFPLLGVIRRPMVMQSMAACISSMVIIFLAIDSHIFILYRFHINVTLLHMIFAGHIIEFFSLSYLEWAIAIGLSFLIVTIEIILAKGLWSWHLKRDLFPYSKAVFGTLASCFLFSYVILVLSMSYRINAFSQQTKVFPYYTQMMAYLFPQKHALKRIENFDSGYYSQLRQVNASLRYPLHPIITGQWPAERYNILIIVIDAWRFDALTKKITPHLARFATHAWQFSHHFSGGNATQPGIFSLFYSIPESYWDSMLKQKITPVFMRRLRKNHYQMAIYASAPLTIPAFNLTIFRGIKPLQVETFGENPGQRDRVITQEFLKFLRHRSEKHNFFGFLFYDAAHSYCLPQDFAKPFQPAVRYCYRLGLSNNTNPIPYRNRYNNALYFIDGQIHQVLHALKKDKLLAHTIVLVTGDHGQEFNDNHRNYWEHTSNFTRYQVQTPLIVYWPGKSPKIFSYTTTHYDIVPTLMRHALGVKNPTLDYSIGHDLLDAQARPFIFESSYINIGIRSQDRITLLYPSGTFQVQDLHAKPLSVLPRAAALRYAMRMMRQYDRAST